MHKNFKDRTGIRYNRLIVSKFVGMGKYGARWLCICDCGNEKVVHGGNLTSGMVKSCGCIQKKNIKGQKFGRLLVVNHDHTEKRGEKHYDVYWNCICDCGNTKSVKVDHLLRGQVRSCGCLALASAKSKLVIINSKRGKAHHNYNNDLSDSERESRQINTKELKEWRKQVYKKDGYTCQKCGYNRRDGITKKRRLFHAHHIESWDNNLEKRYNIDNGITFCSDCRMEFHKIYGRGNNTRKQLGLFLHAQVI